MQLEYMKWRLDVVFVVGELFTFIWKRAIRGAMMAEGGLRQYDFVAKEASNWSAMDCFSYERRALQEPKFLQG